MSNLQGNPQTTPKTSEILDMNVIFIWELVGLTDHGHSQGAMQWKIVFPSPSPNSYVEIITLKLVVF